MVDSAIPRTEAAISAAIAALVAARPSAAGHIDTGRYGNVVQGWKAQEAVLVNRIADEVRSSRIRTARGQGLRDLVASEFDTSVPDGPVAALGTFTFTKSPGTFNTGIIRRGTRIRRIANTSVFPQQKDAFYAALDDTYVPGGATQFVLAVQATQPGAGANVTPTDGSGTPMTIPNQYSFVDSVYDTTFFSNPANTVTIDVGGGSDGLIDEDIQRIALSVGISKFGPLLGALSTGALAGTGVKRAATYEDPVSGIATVFIADGSLNGSALWANSIKQYLLANEFVGFGCRADVRRATLNLVAVQATIVLRDGSYQAYTVDIGNSVRSALSDYFSKRPDWFSWKHSAIRGVIAGADPRILTCSSDAVTTPGTGTSIAEPPANATTPSTLPFWSLSSNGLSATYVNPS